MDSTGPLTGAPRRTRSTSSSVISGKQGSDTHSAAHDSASRARARVKRRYAGLLRDRTGVVHRGAERDARPEPVAIGDPGDAQVVHVAFVRCLPTQVGRGIAVRGRDGPPSLGPGRQPAELRRAAPPPRAPTGASSRVTSTWSYVSGSASPCLRRGGRAPRARRRRSPPPRRRRSRRGSSSGRSCRPPPPTARPGRARRVACAASSSTGTPSAGQRRGPAVEVDGDDGPGAVAHRAGRERRGRARRPSAVRRRRGRALRPSRTPRPPSARP